MVHVALKRSGQIPALGGPVKAGCQERRAVGAESDIADGALMDEWWTKWLAGCDIPQPRGPVPSSAGHRLAIRAERHRENVLLVR